MEAESQQPASQPRQEVEPASSLDFWMSRAKDQGFLEFIPTLPSEAAPAQESVNQMELLAVAHSAVYDLEKALVDAPVDFLGTSSDGNSEQEHTDWQQAWENNIKLLKQYFEKAQSTVAAAPLSNVSESKAVEILKNLCHLKHYKDNVGKDSFYEREQPLAWKAANDFLNGLVSNVREESPEIEGPWKLRFHSYRIPESDDYDEHYEITNGKISLLTRLDDEETLQPIVTALNASGTKLYVDDPSPIIISHLEEKVAELEAALQPSDPPSKFYQLSNIADSTGLGDLEKAAAEFMKGYEPRGSILSLDKTLYDAYRVDTVFELVCNFAEEWSSKQVEAALSQRGMKWYITNEQKKELESQERLVTNTIPSYWVGKRDGVKQVLSMLQKIPVIGRINHVAQTAVAFAEFVGTPLCNELVNNDKRRTGKSVYTYADLFLLFLTTKSTINA